MTEPTSKAEPIAYVLIDSRGAEVEVSMQALRDAGLVPASQLLEMTTKLVEVTESLSRQRNEAQDQFLETLTKLEAAERELAHCREAAELLRGFQDAVLLGFRPDGADRVAFEAWLARDQLQRGPAAKSMGVTRFDAGGDPLFDYELERQPVASETEEPSDDDTETDPVNGQLVGARVGYQPAEPEATVCDNCGGPLPDPGQVYALMLPWADGKHFCRKGCASDWQDKNRPAELEATTVVECICIGERNKNCRAVQHKRWDGTLSPAVTRAAEALAAQDPMLRCPTYGELIATLREVRTGFGGPAGELASELAKHLEHRATGGGNG